MTQRCRNKNPVGPNLDALEPPESWKYSVKNLSTLLLDFAQMFSISPLQLSVEECHFMYLRKLQNGSQIMETSAVI